MSWLGCCPDSVVLLGDLLCVCAHVRNNEVTWKRVFGTGGLSGLSVAGPQGILEEEEAVWFQNLQTSALLVGNHVGVCAWFNHLVHLCLPS